ncbi:hydroxylamine reductase [Spirochaetia bacterium]|nr:hydroxylamine reductase [Spirochaetia bacterium]
MSEMFCFQCEQTAGAVSCGGKSGVCGKKSGTAKLQDDLTGALIASAMLAEKNKVLLKNHSLVEKALFSTLTNVNFDDDSIENLIAAVHAEYASHGGASKSFQGFDMTKIWSANEDIRSLKSLILFGLRGIAAYAYHARQLGFSNDEVNGFYYKALAAVGNDDYGMNELLPLVMETGKINFICLEMLDKANTESYGTPAPAAVTLCVEKGPFIVVSGHDLHDLKLLLEQTKDKGVNIYTHGEMLIAHAYPELKKYPHLKGHFGSAWQNQQKEFDKIPAPILFTTNCIMPVKDSYGNNVWTTGPVAYPSTVHIDDKKDFSELVKKAIQLGGYKENHSMTGRNGGKEMTTGFSAGTILSIAGTVIDAVKSGAIKHFFLVGGCDGARDDRGYYTEFVKQTPNDTVILTLGCGKYRFNDLDLGTIGGKVPRLLDMGQCNDAYGAIKVALALSQAFSCGVNDLPLTLVISWYEQKAVSILLTLLYLGIKNIYLGPSLPAFVSPKVIKYLCDNFNIMPVSTPEEDLKKIFKK